MHNIIVLFVYSVFACFLANLHALINRNDLPQFTKKTNECRDEILLDLLKSVAVLLILF